MVRALWLTLLFCVALSADALESARKMVSPEAFESHRKLLSLLFENDANYCDATGCDMGRIVKTLEENGLIDLTLPAGSEVTLSMSCEGKHPFFFMKTVDDTLHAAGLSGYLTRDAALDGEGFRWSVAYTAASAPDPVRLVERFARRGVRVEAIERLDAARWRYRLDMKNATLPATPIEPGQSRKIVRPVRPLWLGVGGVRRLTIRELPGSHWYPEVVVYDKMLHILSMKQNDTRTRYVRLALPKEAAYVKIADRFTLENIRSGLRVDAR